MNTCHFVTYHAYQCSTCIHLSVVMVSVHLGSHLLQTGHIYIFMLFLLAVHHPGEMQNLQILRACDWLVNNLQVLQVFSKESRTLFLSIPPPPPTPSHPPLELSFFLSLHFPPPTTPLLCYKNMCTHTHIRSDGHLLVTKDDCVSLFILFNAILS